MCLNITIIVFITNFYLKLVQQFCALEGRSSEIHVNNSITNCRARRTSVVVIAQYWLRLMAILEAQELKVERVWTLVSFYVGHFKRLPINYENLFEQKHSGTLWEIDLQENGEKYFKETLRMTRSSFNKLCDLMRGIEKKNTKFRDCIPLEKRVAIAIRALASDSEYLGIAGLFGVGKSTVCRILVEFCKNVWTCLSKDYLPDFPFSENIVRRSVEGFLNMGFPQCLGAIDGCHIEVHPNKADATDYYNYKGWHSVVLLALVDFKYRFLYINVGCPGSCNDSSIFENSTLKRYMEECQLLDDLAIEHASTKIPVLLIGDSAFRLSKHMMKPHPFALENSPAVKNFNYKLSKCRRVVENAFGHLKARFRRIGKGIDNHLKNVNMVVAAACVLHNFLMQRKMKYHAFGWMNGEQLKGEEFNRAFPAI